MKTLSCKTPEAAQKRLDAIRSEMEGLGPIILGTLSKRTQTHTLKDGTKRKGPATSSLKLAGTGNRTLPLAMSARSVMVSDRR